MGALQLLNAMNETVMVIIILMYLDILVNKIFIIAIIDTGVMQNFVSIKETRRLDLTFENEELV